jgi:hypothetical protein
MVLIYDSINTILGNAVMSEKEYLVQPELPGKG